MLSNVLQRNAIPPNKHNNEISQWSIEPNIVIMPNLRLADVAATVTGGLNVYLPRTSGIAELIENVYVELDTEKIADNQSVALYASILNLMRENKRQKNVNTVLRRTEIGTFSIYEPPTNTWGTDGAIRADIFSAAGKNALTNNAATTARGLVHLSDFIEFFNSQDVRYLPYLPNLKITVEWKDLTIPNVLRADTTPTGYTILSPKLVYDQVIDRASLDRIPRGMKAVRYLSPEYEYQTLPAVADGSLLRTTVRTQGFDGKYLEDLMISFEGTNDPNRDTAGLGFNSSISQKSEVIQFRLNGATHLPDAGIDKIGRKMMMQVVTRGALNVPYSGYQYAAIGEHDYLNPALQFMVGRMAYTTVGFGVPVGSLYLEYTREGTADSTQSDPILVNLFGRVWRQLEVSPEGRADLSYVPGF